METRKNIIGFASDLFLRYGPRKTTMEDVARICRIGKATLYKYFKNKDELYREILRDEMEYIFDQVRDKIENTNNVRERLRIFFETEYLLLNSRVNLSGVLMNKLSYIDQDIKNIVDEFYGKQKKIIRQILEDGVEKGEIVVGDISLLSLAMMAAGQGLFNYFRDIKDEKRALKSMDYLIDTLFHGIETRKGRV